MCGIVAAVAQRNVVPILIEGLRRLEYRGYDSAGVAVINGHLQRVRSEFSAWMAEHDYISLDQMRGSMNFTACPDPEVYERANYMLMLQGGRGR